MESRLIKLFILFFSSFYLFGLDLNHQVKEILEETFCTSLANLKIERAGGMTNNNFHITFNSQEQYLLRLPGYGTQSFVDRISEKANNKLAYNAGFSPSEVVYSNPEKGIQIAKYITSFQSYQFEDFYDFQFIKEIATLLYKIHNSELLFTNDISIDKRITDLENFLISNKIEFPKEYKTSEYQYDRIRKKLKESSFHKVPSHGDPVPSNFVKLSGQLKLFDWEYSGLNDPAWDLAFLSCAMNYDKKLDKWLISTYSNNEEINLYDRVVFFKPIVEHWLGLWGLLQTISKKDPDEKEFFRKYAISRFSKSKKYYQSNQFKNALERLNEN